MTVVRALQTVRSLRREARREVVWAVDRAVKGALEDARAMSSGPFSLAQLRRLGHPYAVRNAGLFSFAPAVVNLQSGEFRRAWQADAPKVSDSGTRVTARLSNQSGVADYLQYGTQFMVPRPIKQAVEAKARERLAKELALAERRAEYGR